MKSLVQTCVDVLGSELARGWPDVVLACTDEGNPFELPGFDSRFHSALSLDSLVTHTPAWDRGIGVLASMGVVPARVHLRRLLKFVQLHAGPSAFLARDPTRALAPPMFRHVVPFEAGVHSAVYFWGPGTRAVISATKWLAGHGVYAVQLRDRSKRKSVPPKRVTPLRRNRGPGNQ